MKWATEMGNLRGALIAFKKTKELGEPSESVKIEYDPFQNKFYLNASVLPVSVGRDLYEFLKEFYE